MENSGREISQVVLYDGSDASDSGTPFMGPLRKLREIPLIGRIFDLVLRQAESSLRRQFHYTVEGGEVINGKSLQDPLQGFPDSASSVGILIGEDIRGEDNKLGKSFYKLIELILKINGYAKKGLDIKTPSYIFGYPDSGLADQILVDVLAELRTRGPYTHNGHSNGLERVIEHRRRLYGKA